MAGHNSNLRLDQILLEEGLVTNDQIIEALHYQKLHGGKIGSHLMRFGYVEEAGLVQALGRQYGCEGIVLSDIEIPEIIIRFIPSKIAIARRVIPFDYNPEKNLLMVACPDPSDRYLIDELNFVARGKKVKLYIAVEQALKEAIERYYQVGLNLTGELALSDFNDAKQSAAIMVERNQTTDSIETSDFCRGRVLIVGGLPVEREAIKALYDASKWQVQIVDSGDRVPAYLDVGQFDQVIIKQTDSEVTDSLRRQLRLRSSKTVLRAYTRLTDLINEPSQSSTNSLLVENLDLLLLILGSKDKEVDRSLTVGRWASELCLRLNLSRKESAIITSAAYLHDLARHYYEETNVDNEAVIKMTAKLLKSLNYSPEVVHILEAVNQEFLPEEEVGLETLGGSIITAITEMVELIPMHKKVSSEKLATFQVWLNELTGKKVIEPVAKMILELIESKMLAGTMDGRYSHVLILGEQDDQLDKIVERLRQESFQPAVEPTVEEFVNLYQRSVPDMIILIDPANNGRLESNVNRLFDMGVDLSAVPTFILAEAVTSRLSTLLEKGIEDIVPNGDNLNMLAAKMNRIRARGLSSDEQAEAKPERTNGIETRGQLSDMNLIELLQVLGPSRKTLKLSITTPDHDLAVYMVKGRIVHAVSGELVGEEAVYVGIGWSTGWWVMRNIDEARLPESNVEQSNDSIVMEGCRRLDEATRTNLSSRKLRVK